MAEQTIFLPGASGNGEFWLPVVERLRLTKVDIVDWPGFGTTPRDPEINNLSDLAKMVAGKIHQSTDIVAQSMGGVVAMLVALAVPKQINHLVLTATSGGIDMERFNASDWQSEYLRNFSNSPSWFIDDNTDLDNRLREITVPTLLLWGDKDPISPLGVGEYLAKRLPNAEMVVIKGGDHFLAKDNADAVAHHIARFLSNG